MILLLSLGQLSCNGDAIDSAVVPDEVDCSERSYAIPAGRGELAAGWDAEGGRMIFFGGNIAPAEDCASQSEFAGDTWVFETDCDTFAEIETGEAPSPRGRYAAAVDAERGWFILHGGRWREVEEESSGHGHGSSSDYTLYDDLWAFEFASDTWTQLSSGGDGPSARVSHAAVVSDGRFIIHGGNSSESGTAYTAHGDTWAFDLDAGTWTELDADGGPSDRLFHGHALSADQSTLYIYAGGDETSFTSAFLDDLWALDLESLTWTELHGGGSSAPAGRLSSSLVVDDARNRLISWAGHDDETLGNTNQLWAFDLASASWSMFEEGDIYSTPANGTCDFPSDFTDPDLDAPERRYAQGAALTDDGRLITFGGKTDCGVVNDVWSYDLELDAWGEHSPATSGEICLRAFAECESLCY